MEYPALKLVTGSTVVHIGPCEVFAVSLAGDGGNAECDVYDGVNANGERKGHIEVLSGTTFHICLAAQTKFLYGIYVVATATYGIVMVEYKPLKD